MRRIMEYEDIAKVENKTINALSTRYARALERLEKNLRAAYQQEYQNEQ
jgi:DNA-directed RNA polymerase specialized sigma24 family protein